MFGGALESAGMPDTTGRVSAEQLGSIRAYLAHRARYLAMDDEFQERAAHQVEASGGVRASARAPLSAPFVQPATGLHAPDLEQGFPLGCDAKP